MNIEEGLQAWIEGKKAEADAVTLPPPEEARRIRERVGMKQAELAAILGLNAFTIHRWENGKNLPTGENAKHYKELLDRLVQIAKTDKTRK